MYGLSTCHPYPYYSYSTGILPRFSSQIIGMKYGQWFNKVYQSVIRVQNGTKYCNAALAGVSSVESHPELAPNGAKCGDEKVCIFDFLDLHSKSRMSLFQMCHAQKCIPVEQILAIIPCENDC